MMIMPAARERFLILAREESDQAGNLRRLLSPLGEVEVILDQRVTPQDASAWPDGRRWAVGIHLTDEEVEGHEGLMGRVEDFPRMTSWSRALAHLARTLRDDEAVWFVEDDVAGDADSFARLVALTRGQHADLSARNIVSRKEDPDWYFWPNAKGWFETPYRAYQPLCRLSARLIRQLLAFRGQHGHFIFHEILFASLAMQHGMRTLDWEKSAECADCFSTFRYRPEVSTSQAGIAHPVKSPDLHTSICRIPRRKFPRFQEANCQGWSIFKDDYHFLARYCRKHGYSRIVEFGPGDSTRAFLDAGCQVISYEHDLEWLKRTAEDFAHESAAKILHCPEGHTPQDLALSPEMIFVDGPPYRDGQTHSRLQPCEWALKKCGHFLLHDARRPGEQATLNAFATHGMKIIRIPTEKGLAIVIDPSRRPELLRTLGSHHQIKYRGEKQRRWFTDDFLLWSTVFHEQHQAQRILEIGVADGMSANLLLDEIFTHPQSVLYGIQSYRDETGVTLKQQYLSNLHSGGNAERLHLREGKSLEQLSAMIHQGYRQDFDFIHHTGTSPASEFLAEISLAWELLKDGGTMVIRRSEALDHETEAFLFAFHSRYERLFDGASEILIKRH